MQKLMQKTRALRSRKGFTLIEVIVVLIIIAILAAATIPSMMRYVNQARAKSMLAQCRNVYIAAQAVSNIATSEGINGTVYTVADIASSSRPAAINNAIAAYADIASNVLTSDYSITFNAKGAVQSVTYQRGNSGQEVTINSDGTVTYNPALEA